MKYTRKVTNYETGEIVRISLGEHLTITESAQKMKVSRKALTETLLMMEICRREVDEVAGKTRIRLHPEAVEKGLGYRIMGEHGPFDVLSPLCREIIEDDLKAYLTSQCPTRWNPVFEALLSFERHRRGDGMSKLDPQMKVCWIVDHFEEVPAEIIAKGIGVGKSLVYRYLDYRNRQQAGKMHPFKKRPEAGSAEYYGFDVAYL